MTQPRVVIAHDYVTQRGGAERVTLDLLRAFPGSRLVTALYNPGSSFPEFDQFQVETLGLNRFEAFRNDPRRAFPWLARAFDRHVISDADVVICSSSGWSHRVRTSASKLVYCHNPARWLYQPDDYLARVPRWIRRQFTARTIGLRASDARAAASAACYVANSTAVAGRIADTYGIDAEVVHPPRGLSPAGPWEPVDGVQPGFLLTIGRARGYKNTEAVARAVSQRRPGERLVVVGGSQITQPGVTSLPRVTDAQLRWLFDHADGLVAVAFEDFGLTVVEAQAFGLPVVALRAGGYLDTGVEGVTTVFVDSTEPAAIGDGIARLRAVEWDVHRIQALGERFSAEVFARRMHKVVESTLGRRPVPDRGVAGSPHPGGPVVRPVA